MSEMALEPQSRFQSKPSVLSSRVADEVILLDSEAAVYFGLDGVGAFIFELISAGHPLQHVHERLVAAYAADANRLWDDLVGFTGHLIELGLVSRID